MYIFKVMANVSCFKRGGGPDPRVTTTPPPFRIRAKGGGIYVCEYSQNPQTCSHYNFNYTVIAISTSLKNWNTSNCIEYADIQGIPPPKQELKKER